MMSVIIGGDMARTTASVRPEENSASLSADVSSARALMEALNASCASKVSAYTAMPTLRPSSCVRRRRPNVSTMRVMITADGSRRITMATPLMKPA